MKYPRYSGIVVLVIGVMALGFIDHSLKQEKKTLQSSDTTFSFQKNILPLLQANCNPCHFPSGKVYKKLPFDDYKTVVSLGKKLNTRLKQDKQAIINSWIGSGAKKE